MLKKPNLPPKLHDLTYSRTDGLRFTNHGFVIVFSASIRNMCALKA